MKLRFHVDKLIRDRMPEIMGAQGLTVFTQRLDDREFIQRLKEKLVEEAIEARVSASRAELVDELADVREVMLALAQASGVSEAELEARRLAKRGERGGFDDRLLSTGVEGDEGCAGVAYHLARPGQYPKVA